MGLSPHLSLLVTTVFGPPTSSPQVSFVLSPLSYCMGGRDTMSLLLGGPSSWRYESRVETSHHEYRSLSHNYSASASSELLAVKRSRGARSKPSSSSESQDSGTKRSPLTMLPGRGPEALPGMTPSLKRSPAPSRLQKFSYSSRYFGGLTCKSRTIWQLFLLRLCWGVLLTTSLRSYILSVSAGFFPFRD